LDFTFIWAFVIGRAILRNIRSLIMSRFWSSWVYCWTAWSLHGWSM